MKKVLVILLALAMVLSFAACGSAPAETPASEATAAAEDTVYTVGICQLVQHAALDAATQGFVDTLKAEFGDKVNIIEQNASNDIPTCSTIVNGFVSDNVDLILANATPALQATVEATDTIPILGTSVTEYGVALGTFADSRVLEKLGEELADACNVAYELTFLVMGIVCAVYVLGVKKQRLIPKQEGPKYLGAVCETIGQFFYIYALADTEHVAFAAPIIYSYCVASVVWGRIFLKEKLSKKHYACIALVVAGIVIMGILDI